MTTDNNNSLDHTNPNGIPDRLLSEAEAARWLLSEAQRRAGARVTFDPATARWRTGRVIRTATTRTTCASCGHDFDAIRRTARFCSGTCRTRSHKRLGNAKKPGGTWDMQEAKIAS